MILKTGRESSSAAPQLPLYRDLLATSSPASLCHCGCAPCLPQRARSLALNGPAIEFAGGKPLHHMWTHQLSCSMMIYRRSSIRENALSGAHMRGPLQRL